MPWIQIHHDDSLPPLEIIDLPEHSSAWLHAVYRAIDCECIEVANTVFRDLVLVLDESGKLWDGWENRVNVVASWLYGNPFDPIVGDVILCRRSGADLIPITERDLNRVCSALSLDTPTRQVRSDDARRGCDS